MNVQRVLRVAQKGWRTVGHRSMAVSSANMAAEMDPVQKLYLDQVLSYANQSKKIGWGPVDAGAGYQQMKDDAIERLKKVFAIDNPKTFPEVKFTEPDLNQDVVE